MAEYIALVFGAVALMFVLLEIGFNIATPRIIDTGTLDVMDFIKILFILGGFAMGFFVIGITMAIAAENGASAGVQSILSVSLVVWGILFVAIIAAFVVYYVWWIPKKLGEMQKQQKKRYDEAID